MKTHLFKILILLTVIFAGCENDQKVKQLPAETQEGKNTFGCYVENTIWLAENDKTCVLCQQNVNATYDPNTGETIIAAFKYKTDDGYENIRLYSKNINSSGDFALSIDINNSMTSYTKTQSNGTTTDKYLLVNQGNLHISKLDTVNRIISGTFSFNASNGNTTVSITKGVFDAKY